MVQAGKTSPESTQVSILGSFHFEVGEKKNKFSKRVENKNIFKYPWKIIHRR